MSEPDTGQVPSTKPRHIAQRTRFGRVCFVIYCLVFVVMVIGTISSNSQLPIDQKLTSSGLAMQIAVSSLLFIVPYWLLMWLMYYAPGWIRRWWAAIAWILLIFSGGE